MTIHELEEKLTPEQKAKAFTIAEAEGWERGSTPPEYVWRTIFLEVLK